MPAAAAVARLDKPSSPGRQGTAAAGSPAPGATGAAQPLIIHAVPPTDESKKVTWMIHGPRRCREARQVVFNSVFETCADKACEKHTVRAAYLLHRELLFLACTCSHLLFIAFSCALIAGMRGVQGRAAVDAPQGHGPHPLGQGRRVH